MPSTRKTLDMPTVDTALPGRLAAIPTARAHVVTGHPLKGPYPDGMEIAVLAMGCFWGVERLFWTIPGVHVTAAGYAAGITPNPTHEEVRTGRTGHAEGVQIVFDPRLVTYESLLKIFWENHDPTQGQRQGGDIGTQYRSGVYVTSDSQAAAAVASKEAYQQALEAQALGAITTQIGAAGPFYFAEAYHQQYLAKNPDGYRGVGGTGVVCPIGAGVEA
jgi:peptide-methionine (S)-S-oxide reductase